MRKETTYYDSNLDVTATYQGTEILSLEKLFKLSEGLPIDIVLKSENVDIHVTLVDVTQFPKPKGVGFRVNAQLIAKFTEREH